ncbi:MAG: alpha/beta fold hydrolase [Halobacteriales archaeon]|nr:alpha/beta fold hydrolase [Halobacteriales archaeon]
MDTVVFGRDGETELLFVLGFRARIGGANEQWFISRLTDAGYRVHVVELPTNITDFNAQYRDPVQRYHDEHEPAIVLGHSLGGLVAAHLDTDAKRVYLAPWWGIYGEKLMTWETVVIPRLPIKAEIIAASIERGDLGEHVSDAEFDRLTKRVSPALITAVYNAQQARPSIDESAVVFASLRETVVSLRAIGEAVSTDQLRIYDGAHIPYASANRQATTDEILATLTA